jgi:hypothetical protein
LEHLIYPLIEKSNNYWLFVNRLIINWITNIYTGLNEALDLVISLHY